jgi:hypothetical protein
VKNQRSGYTYSPVRGREPWRGCTVPASGPGLTGLRTSKSNRPVRRIEPDRKYHTRSTPRTLGLPDGFRKIQCLLMSQMQNYPGPDVPRKPPGSQTSWRNRSVTYPTLPEEGRLDGNGFYYRFRRQKPENQLRFAKFLSFPANPGPEFGCDARRRRSSLRRRKLWLL